MASLNRYPWLPLFALIILFAGLPCSHSVVPSNDELWSFSLFYHKFHFIFTSDNFDPSYLAKAIWLVEGDSGINSHSFKSLLWLYIEEGKVVRHNEVGK